MPTSSTRWHATGVHNIPSFSFSPFSLSLPLFCLSFKLLPSFTAGIHRTLQFPFHRKLEELKKYGGIEQLAKDLHTSLTDGLPEGVPDAGERVEAFGRNVYPEPPMKGFLKLWLEALSDTTLIILVVAAILSLVLGLVVGGTKQKVLPDCAEKEALLEDEDDSNLDWIEGLAILVAVAVVSLVSAGNDYSKEKKFRALSAKEKEIQVKTIRGGKECLVLITDLLVGDVVALDTGDQIPADGLFISGFELKCDESQMTGESDMVKKSPSAPFMLSGCKISEGNCSMLLTGVGIHSEWGNIIGTMGEKPRPTPLQVKLDDMATSISVFGLAVAGIIFVVLTLSWIIPALVNDNVYDLTDKCTQGPSDLRIPNHDYREYDWGQTAALVDFFIVSMTIIAVAVPEGLPLAVTISLAYSMKQMYQDQNLVRHLKACETMSNCTNICSDKTGTLTENRMTIVRGWVAEKKFESRDQSKKLFDKTVIPLLREGIAMNSAPTSNVEKNESGTYDIVGNKTECALLLMLLKMGIDYKKVRKELNGKIFQRVPFSSKIKRMATYLTTEAGGIRLLCKGAPEIILEHCTQYRNGASVEPLTEEKKKELLAYIAESASKGFRTIGLAYRDLPRQEGHFAEIPDEMVCYAIFGIEDPLRPEVPNAVRACQGAGITVRMVTGDNIMTARKIATDCHIIDPAIDPDAIAMEGPDFAQLSDSKLDELLPHLRVLARSAPSDKQRLVRRLIENGEVVAVTGDGTNDVPALKEADVGLAMGIRGTDIAKQAADIVILDDNFQSIVTAVKWGRNVYDNIRKFLQYQLTINVAALAVVVIGAVGQRGAPLKAIQLLWINLIMDTLAALALGTEKPTNALLKRKPFARDDSLLSPVMLRFIAVNAVYQIVLLIVVLYVAQHVGFLDCGCAFKDKETLECPSKVINDDTTTVQSIIFNTFVFCQIFNFINARRVNGELDFYSGLFTNFVYLAIFVLITVFQVLIIFFTGEFFGVTPYPGIGWKQWLTCLVLGVVELPLAYLIALIPVPKPKISESSAFLPDESSAHGKKDAEMESVSVDQ